MALEPAVDVPTADLVTSFTPGDFVDI